MRIEEMKLNSNKVKAARVANGYTQADISKKLGISANAYSKKENGNTEFKLKEAIIIADLLDMEIGDIFFYSKVEINSTNKHSA